MRNDTNDMTEGQALRRLAALCSRGEHSSGEMKAKMRAWGLDEEAQTRVMERLMADRYVDDERFARLFVADKLKFNHWGHRKIEQALWAKGVADATAQSALDQLSRDDFMEVLRPLMEQKARQLHAESAYERRMKLIRFALSRGFSMDEAEEAATELFT